MSKRKSSVQPVDSVVVEQSDENEVVVNGSTSDEEIAALLEAADPDEGIETDTVVVEDAEPVEALSDDVEAILADVEASAESSKPAKKRGAKKSDTVKAPKKADVPVREFSEVAAIDIATFNASIDAAAKKIAEKANNLVGAVTRGQRLSRYTQIAVAALVDDGRISGKALVEKYTEAGLGIGTARSQAQQMTSLFKIAGLAVPDALNARELVIADENFAAELVKLAA